jgi:hypothetical protein
MSTRITSTLDPNRMGPMLDLSQGNLIVTNTDVCDFHRAVFGTIAYGAGRASWSTYFYSNSQPAAGLVNLLSVGLVAEGQCSLSKYVGEESLSFGLRPADGRVDNNAIEISSNSGGSEIQPIAERRCITTYLDMTGSTKIAAWTVDGNTVFQCALPDGYFWLPAISIGCTVAGDVSAQTNFGQNLLDFPTVTIDR